MDFSSERRKSTRARYVYGIIFLIPNLCAWVVRDYGQVVLLLPQFHYLKSCGTEGRDCFHTLGVLRVSLGCFECFSLMFLTTFITRKLYDSKWWTFKLFLLIMSLLFPACIPSAFVQLYGELARVGAGCSTGLFMSTLFYIASIGGCIFVFIIWHKTLM